MEDQPHPLHLWIIVSSYTYKCHHHSEGNRQYERAYLSVSTFSSLHLLTLATYVIENRIRSWAAELWLVRDHFLFFDFFWPQVFLLVFYHFQAIVGLDCKPSMNVFGQRFCWSKRGKIESSVKCRFNVRSVVDVI